MCKNRVLCRHLEATRGELSARSSELALARREALTYPAPRPGQSAPSDNNGCRMISILNFFILLKYDSNSDVSDGLRSEVRALSQQILNLQEDRRNWLQLLQEVADTLTSPGSPGDGPSQVRVTEEDQVRSALSNIQKAIEERDRQISQQQHLLDEQTRSQNRQKKQSMPYYGIPFDKVSSGIVFLLVCRGN